MEFISRVDRAHLVMLAERGIVDRGRAARVLKEIEHLRACRFAPLWAKAAPRGIYLLYENYLIEKLGPETGGILQTARSRNDLNATTLRLRLREPYLHLLGEALRLQAVLLGRARRHVDAVMPAYTHYQAAVPVTYAHYLAGVAVSTSRDIAALFEAGEDINRSPLGAGAVGGTSLPIDQIRTAALLGFAGPSLNSIDAVASRDLVLRLLAATAIFGVTLSRLATDMLLWSTAEFGFLSFPDQLVGSSSMMPQKRNPFLLEHVQGRSASVLGAFVAAAAAMHSKPFTNSISVGTEATAGIYESMKSITEAVTLIRVMVGGAVPQTEAMLQRAEKGFTSATELANRLTADGRLSFRVAHRVVGAMIKEAIERDEDSIDSAAARCAAEAAVGGLDPASIARSSDYGGGPGRASFDRCLAELKAKWAEQVRAKLKQGRRWREAETGLNEAVGRLVESARDQSTGR
jgi:argininosuccinate lyase